MVLNSTDKGVSHKANNTVLDCFPNSLQTTFLLNGVAQHSGCEPLKGAACLTALQSRIFPFFTLNWAKLGFHYRSELEGIGEKKKTKRRVLILQPPLKRTNCLGRRNIVLGIMLIKFCCVSLNHDMNKLTPF